jgi:acyl-CoA synthetase (AMP-forming)/AMP-acid ligase II
MDTMCYIFTSGTTGLPKSAKVTHAKAHAGGAIPCSFALRSSDRIYTVMPLYHSSALLVSFGLCITKGSAIILAKKFSASKFWDEAIRHEATAFSYIGEIARYLTNAYPSAKACKEIRAKSQVRIAFGNGLGLDVWPKLSEYFGIKEIGEFYSATEATSGMLNYSTDAISGMGACGRVGPILSVVFKVRLHCHLTFLVNDSQV